MTRWAILTGEYPPDPGGVSDYTRLVARGLVAAGDAVRVYVPPRRGGSESDDPGVEIHRLPGRFGPQSLLLLEELLLTRPRPDRILLQYVPHSYGCKAMNLPFALWVAMRARRIAPVWVMFHEVAFPFHIRPVTHALLGTATRIMARLIAGAADRVFVSIPAWGTLLKKLAPRMKPAEWLPVPCNVPTDADPATVVAVRSRFAPEGGTLVGHFGTFGDMIAELLAPAVAEMLRLTSTSAALFIGRGSDQFRERFVVAHPSYANRVYSVGEIAATDISAHLRACDLLLQPFPDGISSRRTSAMAGLANGIPIATNLGALSEPIWSQGAVAAVATPDPAALANLAAALVVDSLSREELGRRGQCLYRDMFALARTIDRLRGKG